MGHDLPLDRETPPNFRDGDGDNVQPRGRRVRIRARRAAKESAIVRRNLTKTALPREIGYNPTHVSGLLASRITPSPKMQRRLLDAPGPGRLMISSRSPSRTAAAGARCGISSRWVEADPAGRLSYSSWATEESRSQSRHDSRQNAIVCLSSALPFFVNRRGQANLSAQTPADPTLR